jgi:hypothetical protein
MTESPIDAELARQAREKATPDSLRKWREEYRLRESCGWLVAKNVYMHQSEDEFKAAIDDLLARPQLFRLTFAIVPNNPVRGETVYVPGAAILNPASQMIQGVHLYYAPYERECDLILLVDGTFVTIDHDPLSARPGFHVGGSCGGYGYFLKACANAVSREVVSHVLESACTTNWTAAQQTEPPIPAISASPLPINLASNDESSIKKTRRWFSR